MQVVRSSPFSWLGIGLHIKQQGELDFAHWIALSGAADMACLAQ